MRLAILLMSGLFASACSASGDRDASSDSTALPAPQAAAADTASRGPQAPRGPHAADSACSEVRAIAVRTLGITLEADDAPTFDAPRELGRWSGCRYTASFAMASDSVPSNLLRAALLAGGWRSDNDWDADGADGTEYALSREPALCHVSFTIPDAGYEDVDTDDAAEDPGARRIAYHLEIRCTAPVPLLRPSS